MSEIDVGNVYVGATIKEDVNIKYKVQCESFTQKSDTFLLYFSFIMGTLPFIFTGISMAWLSPMLTYLESNDSNVNPLGNPITVIETSMLAGIPVFFGLIGCLIFPKLADTVGRKNTLLLIGLIIFMTSLGTAFSKSVLSIVIFRTIYGFLLLGIWLVNQLYISELCEDHNRGKFLCLKAASLPLGNLIAYVAGSHLGYINFNIFCAILVIPFFLFWFAPETPVYYFSKGNIEECKASLKKLRSNKNIEELNEDFNKIKEIVEATQSVDDTNYLSLFETKESRLGLMFTLFLCTLQFLSGMPIITNFLGPLLHQAESIYSAGSMTIIAALAQILSLFLTSFVVERFGRKTLLIISCDGCGLSLFSFGLYYYLKSQHSTIISYIQWAPITCIITYVIIFAVGLGPLPLTIVAEIFPPKLAGVGLSLGLNCANMVIGLLLFVYPILAKFIGVHSCMWMLSGFCIIGGVLIHWFVPETRGKSSIEIQDMLKTY